eukprot:CAMPEP_0185580684 /NCGR_PEP_ID=MMETSP0434-20130131/17434_1 /TAXON_ID=626734 ORGANISM="Favella taraikaensis, Strain Fe Narragansett Bay" /NCGR_SAMPLE_ID=MMETSP0434 /ASSEMBLY_ACC=CAM_ASM_000379 /LENGTH=55 /DNA_ID=CAMNT_0028199015 /DNA_START=416 /DNA_END=583 /DNA_ORIENTATION=+
MYAVFKEAGTPLPRDYDLVDYGFNFDEDPVFREGELNEENDAEMANNNHAAHQNL